MTENQSTPEPTGDLAAVIAALKVPFDSKIIEFKPGKVSADGTRALALAFVDMRAYLDRLDEVCPEWTSAVNVHITNDKVVVVCQIWITVNGITLQRSSTGEAKLTDMNAVTSAEAQAFKRTCVMLGLGRSLYALPQVWVNYDSQKKKFDQKALQSLRDTIDSNAELPAAQDDDTAPQNAPTTNPPPSTPPSGVPKCPDCGGDMWDNRVNKKNPKGPDFKCKNSSCMKAIWLPKPTAASG